MRALAIALLLALASPTLAQGSAVQTAANALFAREECGVPIPDEFLREWSLEAAAEVGDIDQSNAQIAMTYIRLKLRLIDGGVIDEFCDVISERFDRIMRD